MSVNDVYLSLRAAQVQRAIRRTSCRHVHLSARPLVVSGYHLAGDRGAPVALMWGTDPDNPHTLAVPEPRNRGLRFRALAEFASALCVYFDDPDNDDPQIVVPNAATANWLFDVVGRFTWNQPTEGEWAVDPVIPRAGKHLMFLGEEFDHPGSSTVAIAVGLLTHHYRTGQSADEDLNLGSALGWVLPEPGLTGRETALKLEAGPPAGPVSEPRWDVRYLEPQVRAYREAEGNADGERAATRLLRAYAETQLSVGWEQVWTVLELLSRLQPGSRVADRRAEDRHRFEIHIERMRGEARFAARPGPRAAAVRLNIIETAQGWHETAMLLDDPLLLAARIADGTAVAGRVVAVDATNRDHVPARNGTRRQLRPVITIEPVVDTYASTDDVLRLATDPSIHAVIRTSTGGAGGLGDASGVETPAHIELTITSGANIAKTAERLPGVGDLVVFSDVGPPEGFKRPDPPPVTPWTHLLPGDADPAGASGFDGPADRGESATHAGLGAVAGSVDSGPAGTRSAS